jgi:hypothetical protein
MTDAPTSALLLEIRAEQAAQRAILDRILQALDKPRRHAPPSVSDADLVTAIAASNPTGACFSAAELIGHTAVDMRLRQVLSGGLLDRRRLGNKLRTLAGLEVAGFVLQRVARDESGCIWQLHTACRHASAAGA